MSCCVATVATLLSMSRPSGRVGAQHAPPRATLSRVNRWYVRRRTASTCVGRDPGTPATPLGYADLGRVVVVALDDPRVWHVHAPPRTRGRRRAPRAIHGGSAPGCRLGRPDRGSPPSFTGGGGTGTCRRTRFGPRSGPTLHALSVTGVGLCPTSVTPQDFDLSLGTLQGRVHNPS
jgi:hypothetical protein